MARQVAALVLFLASSVAMCSVATGKCASEKFPAGRTYATCTDLPHLGAALHWTYNAATSELSVAFVATPAAPQGWVAWGLNPTGEGMVGTQALVALKGSSASPTVKTYNITGYVPLGSSSTPIAFPASDLAADVGSDGKIRLYGKLQLQKGLKEVNQVWQVGSSVTGGAPDRHAFNAENLASKGKLVLAAAPTPSTAPAPAPAPTSGGKSSASPGPAPPTGGKSDAASPLVPSGGKLAPSPGTPSSAGRNSNTPSSSAAVSAPALMVLAILGFLAII